MKYRHLLSCLPAAALLCSCGGIDAGNNNFHIGLKFEASASPHLDSVSTQGADTLVYRSDAGNIAVEGGAHSASAGSTISIKSDTQESADKIAESLYFFTETKDTSLVLTLSTHLKDGQDVWRFIKDSEYKDTVTVAADTSVSVPDAISICDIENGAGDIQLSRFSGKAKLETGTGDVTVTGSVLSGATEIETGAGSITVELAGAPDMGSELDISTGVGDIDLTLPGSLNDDTVIELDTGAGSISLDTGGHEYTVTSSEGAVTSHQMELDIEGKCRIIMNTGTGDIDIKEPSVRDE